MTVTLTPPRLDTQSALFPDAAERRRLDDVLSEALGGALQRVAQGRVSPIMTASDIRHALKRFDFATPTPMADLLPWVLGQLEHGLVQMTHPRYFGLFNPAPAFLAECADRIASAFNPQLASATTSPAAVAIDAHVIAAVAARAGLVGDVAGHFTSGGTEANSTALTCALTRADARFATEGARGLRGPPTLYVSHDAHLAWFKIAHQAGIGRAAVRLVATDGTGRMHSADLAAAIARDTARGCVPVMVVATAGTTGAGMVDPLPACAAVARDAGAWLHVDAAWGGALLASDRLRWALDGIELADSITIDAHKWLAATMGCGMFLTSRAAVLSQAYRVSQDVAPFMPSNDLQQDPYVTTAQWSRRFLGLRLFMMLAAAGWEGIAQHVERSVVLTALLRADLLAAGWRVANDSPMAVLCAEPPPGAPDPRLIVTRVVASGEAWLTTTRFMGRDVVRVCLTNGRTTARDVGQLVKVLQDAAAHGCTETTASPFPGNKDIMNVTNDLGYRRTIAEMCGLPWTSLTDDDMVSVAWAYYYFSVQFRECLVKARTLYPQDEKLLHLEQEECGTPNLSPWPGVAEPGEAMNHDEFMRRTLLLAPIDASRSGFFSDVGTAYLEQTRAFDDLTRATAIASYEDGGLEMLFTAILRFDKWNGPVLQAFRHFLSEHVRFDSDPDQGHGALSRHMAPDERVIVMWEAFQHLLITCVPALSTMARKPMIRSVILAEIAVVAESQQKPLPPLTDGLALLDSGLDSLCIAMLVAALDDKLGVDPFDNEELVTFPVTVGDFIKLYEHAAA